MTHRHRAVALAIAFALVAAACSPGNDEGDALGPERRDLDRPRPDIPEGPLDPAVEANLDTVFTDPTFLTEGDLPALGRSGDPRVAWPLVDLARFHQGPDTSFRVVEPLSELVGFEPGEDEIPWVVFTNQLLAWDVPAPPRYLEWKQTIFLASDPSWEPFFDPEADLDWREVTWGGVFRDGIETLVDPPVVRGANADYLDPDEVVFGLEIDGEIRAYPRRHLAVHELVSDTVGDRRIAIPFCTLCGSVIGYFVDEPPAGFDPFELRTSGLLVRSNKLMFDVHTESLVHQFTGIAVTGPLHEAGVELPSFNIAVTTWADWLESRPDTTVLAEDAGTGRDYAPGFLGDPTGGAPEFAVGDIDDRLPAEETVLGVETIDGATVAFPVRAAREALEAGDAVTAFGVELRLDAGALVARSAGTGPELPHHEAFWFAWSQFRPDTLLWTP